MLVIVGIAAGPILAKVKKLWVRRLAGWLVLVAVIAGADFALSNDAAVFRMMGICCVLLGGMKGLVYAEWAGEHRLTVLRYSVFAFLWFGMDPASFQNRREELSWKSDVRLGLLLMLVGTLGAWLVWAMEWRQIFIMFLPMSLGFHFGALRVLKGGLRAAGFPVRTLFPNVLDTQGVGDFWSRRWNVGYSQMMQRLVGRPVETLAGMNAGLMAVFVASGILHELAITLPVRSGFGLPTLYFTLHGSLTLLERKWGRPFGKFPALLAVILPLGLLFPPGFQNEVIASCLGVFDLLKGVLAG
ncbi:MAG: MBOAT family protein [Verrucomicrobiota bacterium]